MIAGFIIVMAGHQCPSGLDPAISNQSLSQAAGDARAKPAHDEFGLYRPFPEAC
jgi:hypothetical protein